MARLTALSSPAALLLFLLTAGIGVALDQWSKIAAFDRLSDGVEWNADHTWVDAHPKEIHQFGQLHPYYQFIPGYLHFSVIANRGAVFGVGQGRRMLFIGVSVAAILFIFYLFAVSERQRFYQFILGMLLAGVLGNLYDRIKFEYVRDMIHALPRWEKFFPYIFNVADSLLCVGVFLMIVHSFFKLAIAEVIHVHGFPSRIISPMPDPLSDADLQFLRRAIRLAMNGRGRVEPNPMVGCVITKSGEILGEGFHEQFGGAHAEPNALAACGEPTKGATAYVTLEPCCHTNKKTPPCGPAILAAGISRVVVGCTDPNPQVSGKGIAELRKAGVRVDEADDPACRQLIAPYIAAAVHHRPYLTLKWAQTADGKVAGPGGRRVQISNKRSQQLIHELRSRSDAILIGIGTAAADDPLLTARRVDFARPLIRVVLDSDLRLSIDSQLVRTIDRGKVLIFCSKEAADFSGTRVPLAACGVEIHPVPSDSPGRLNLQRIIEQIGAMGVTHLLVEPGPTLARSFLQEKLWDRAWVVRSPLLIDDPTAPDAAPPENAVATVELDSDRLTEYLNPCGCAGSFPTADFVLCAESYDFQK